VHPNVKLFVSHGGLNGVYEAVDGGVPILAFPVFADQPKYVDLLVEAGMAISMDILTVSKDELLNNIVKLVDDKKYETDRRITGGGCFFTSYFWRKYDRNV